MRQEISQEFVQWGGLNPKTSKTTVLYLLSFCLCQIKKTLKDNIKDRGQNLTF